MKRAIYLVVTALLIASILTGCAKQEPTDPFRKQNEIITYEPIDPNKTQLVVSRTGNIEITGFCREFMNLNPDIQIVYIDITGGNSANKPLIKWIQNGCLPDVVISAASFFDREMTLQYFTNLSANPIVGNYETAALNRTATDDNIYWLPGPSTVSAMMYNKTLFAQYGWSVPQTFDEFIQLCLTIRKDTNGEVEPWNPNAKYSQELMTAIEAFVYEEVFGGVENRAWYNDFIRGEESFAGHMEPYYDTLQTLVENGLLREEHFTYSATTRGEEFAAGKIAMINMNIYDADNDTFDFGYMPYPTTKGQVGYVSDKYSSYVGVPKKERTDQQNDAIDRFLAYFSSPQGQRAYIGQTLMVSNVKDVPLNQTDDLAALNPAIRDGHMFALMEFISADGTPCNISLQSAAQDMAAGTRSRDECLAEAVQATPYTPKKPSAENTEEAVAKAERNMTVLETSFYIADAYREAAQADIGLISHGVAYRGNLMRIFAGDITPSFIAVLKPRSFANGSKLQKLMMTGSQLLEALNEPPDYSGGKANAIYAYSGLQCEIAPWKPLGQKYLSVKLADGSDIIPDKRYTIAAWEGTIDGRYITETPETVEGSFEDIMTEKFKHNGIVHPMNEGRIQLRWE